MCDAQLNPMSIKISEDPSAEFKNLVTLMKDPTANDEDDEEGNNDSDEEAGIME